MDFGPIPVKFKKSKKPLIITAIAVAVVALIILGFYFIPGLLTTEAGIVTQGVYFGKQDLSGLNQQQATEKIQLQINQYLSSGTQVNCQEQQWHLTLKDLGISFKADEAVKQALEMGKQGSDLVNLRQQHFIARDGAEIVLAPDWDQEVFQQKLAETTADLVVDPINAKFAISGSGEVTITDSGQNGTSPDLETAAQDFSGLLKQADYVTDLVLNVNMMSVTPEITEQTIADYGLNCLLSSFSTNFSTSSAARATNVRTAAASLNDVLVAPGEEVSYNEVVGPRTADRGYQKATVIINNEFVPDWGGGVCQVSSTLYDAVLYADLEIVTRSNHSLPVSYVRRGLDATVSYGGVDFIFKNNTDKHIYLTSSAYGGTLTINIYGNSAYKKSVQIVTDQNGNRVSGKKIITDSEGNVTEKQIPSSTYSQG